MLVAQYVLRFGVLLGLAFAASGCAGNDFSALKSLPPPFGYIGFRVHHPRDCEDGSDHPARLALTPARWQELKRINGEVNALPEISDQENYGTGNIWSYPDAKGGDCEDMAMEKQRRCADGGRLAGRRLADRHRRKQGWRRSCRPDRRHEGRRSRSRQSRHDHPSVVGDTLSLAGAAIEQAALYLAQCRPQGALR